MSAQKTPTDTQTVDNVQQITEAATQAANAGAREVKSLAASTFGSIKKGASFLWHTSLGTAITAEQFFLSTARDMEKKGVDYEKKSKKVISKQVDKVNKSTAGLRQKARNRINGVEEMFEKGTDRSLHFLGVPTRSDVNELTSLIRDLAESVNELSGKTESMADHGKDNSRSKRSPSTTTA